MLKKLKNKKFVKSLEISTTPIVNLIGSIPQEDRQKFYDILMKLHMWYHRKDIDANASIYKKWDKISELLGTKPIYCPTHTHRNALWAFQWETENVESTENNYVLIYYDITGMKIQVNEKIRKTEIVPMMNYLNEKINGNS